jgi:glutamyl-tRNA synthetase
VVVDDAAMGIDQVVRGDDLATSTPRHIVLQRLLGLPSPPDVEFAHVPLVLGSSGARLAKRDGAVTLADLRSAGASAEEVLAVLAQSLDLAAPGERVHPQLLVERFDPGALPRSAWVWPGLENAATS